MGLLTPCFVPKGGFLYTMFVQGGGFLLPSSRVPGVCPGGMVLDEIDICVNNSIKILTVTDPVHHSNFFLGYENYEEAFCVKPSMF